MEIQLHFKTSEIEIPEKRFLFLLFSMKNVLNIFQIKDIIFDDTIN